MKSIRVYLPAVMMMIPLAIPFDMPSAYALDTLKWQDYEQRGYMNTQKRKFEAVELALINTLQKLNSNGQAPDAVALPLLEKLSIVTANQGKYDSALEYTELALRFAERMKDDGRLSNLYSAQGNLQRQLKRFTEAELSYDKAIKLCPASTFAIVGLARVKLDEDQLKQSRELFEKAFAQQKAGSAQPSPPELTRYAECCYRNNDFDAAQKALEEGLSIDEKELGNEHPALAAELNDLAIVLAAQGKVEEARKQMKRAVDICTKYKYDDLKDWTKNLQLVQK